MFDHQQWLQSRNEMLRRLESEEEENYQIAEPEEDKKTQAEKEKAATPTPKDSEALKELKPADKAAIKAPEKSATPAKKEKPAPKKVRPTQTTKVPEQKGNKTAAKKAVVKAPEKDKTNKAKLLFNNRQELLELYYTYKKTEGHWQNIPAKDEFGVSDPERNRAKREEEARLQTLNRALKAQNFSGIGELEAYIGNYEKKFEQQTLALAEEAFDRSNKQLLEEEQHLTNDTYVALLFRQLAESGAREHYAVAAGKSAEANGIRRDLGGYAHGDLERKGQLQKQARNEKQAGIAAVKTLISPLVQDKQFDHEALAGAKNKEDLKRILIKHIQTKRKSIAYSRKDLRENPEHIYEMDVLVQASLQKNNAGGILQQIVQHKMEQLGTEKTVKAVVITTVAVALTLLSFGGATPFLLAGLGSAGLSLYGVYEAVEDYKRKNAANEVGILSEDLSLLWVMLAIGGAGADFAALTSAFKVAPQIAKVAREFNAGGKIVEFEEALAKIKGLDKRIQNNLVKKARIESQEKEFVKNQLKLRGMNFATLPGLIQSGEFLMHSIFAIRKGIVELDTVISNLTKKGILKSINISDAEKKLAEQIFEKAKEVTKLEGKLAEEIEEALSRGDYKKVRDLVNDFEIFNLNNKYLPKNCKIYPEKGSFIFRDLLTDEDVGLVTLKDSYLEFAIYRKGLKTEVSGQQVFNSLIEELKLNKTSYKGIRGYWNTKSDNTSKFNAAIVNKLTLKQAAFKTWTGERALEQGFENVKIDFLSPENPPFTKIQVTFY